MNCDEMVEMLFDVYCFHTTPQKHSKIIYKISFFNLNEKILLISFYTYIQSIFAEGSLIKKHRKITPPS